MAENAVTLIALLAEKLLKLVNDEGRIFRGVHSDVKHIVNLLNQIKPLTKNAEEKVLIEGVKHWMNELRKVVFRMEDVVDLYLFKVAKRDGVRFWNALYLLKWKIRSVKYRRRISSEIGDIKQTLSDICNLSTSLGLQPFHGQTLPDEIPRCLYL